MNHPELLEEWSYEKNADISPDLVTPGRSKKAWWKCKVCQYEWYASVFDRVKGRGCPHCSHRVVITGLDDLATLRPELMKEWVFEKNTLDPTKTPIHSGKKAWWKCSVCGNEWLATIATRSDGRGCPKWREHRKLQQAKTRE